MGLWNCLMAIPSGEVGLAGLPPARCRRFLSPPHLLGAYQFHQRCQSPPHLLGAYQFHQRWGSFPGPKGLASRANRRGRLACQMKGSDMVSELELGRIEGRREPRRRVNGIFWILLLNISIYVADHIFQVRTIRSLYLYHSRPTWYQFVTATFCHVNWNHLSSNLFFLYIFGKLVEEEEGNFALWLSYILTGAGANLVSWLVLPSNAVSIGASGAVFGLFAISVLVKISWDWRKILEVLILGQFVIDKVMEAAQASTGLAGPLGRGYSLQTVNHIAHLSGALIGAALILLISRVPSESSTGEGKVLKTDKEKPK